MRGACVGIACLGMALGAIACSDDPNARRDGGVDATAGSDAGGDEDGDVPPDAGPADASDVDAGNGCSTPTPDRATICGVVRRDPSLPLGDGPARDGAGSLVVLAWDCDPFEETGPDSCGGRDPLLIGDVFFLARDVDLGPEGAEAPYALENLPESVVYVAAVLVDSSHDLGDGLFPGDWVTRPTTAVDVAAGESREQDVELNVLVRGVRARVTLDPALEPWHDAAGGLAVLGWSGSPMPGSMPDIGAVYGCADLGVAGAEALVLVSTFDPRTYYMVPFLDDDESGLMMGASTGDLVGLPAEPIVIRTNDVIVDVDLALNTVVDNGDEDAGVPDGGAPDGGDAPGCADASM